MTDPQTTRLPVKPAEDMPTDETGWVTAIKNWAYQLTVLKVVTYVGDATIEVNDDGIPNKIDVQPEGKALVTICDLIGGDITNVIPKEYKDDEGLRTFHLQQVAAAAAVLPSNLRVLSDLLNTVLKR